jgi:hypothetical protein
VENQLDGKINQLDGKINQLSGKHDCISLGLNRKSQQNRAGQCHLITNHNRNYPELLTCCWTKRDCEHGPEAVGTKSYLKKRCFKHDNIVGSISIAILAQLMLSVV